MPLFGETFGGPEAITVNELEDVCSGYRVCITASVCGGVGGKAGFLEARDSFFFCISDTAGLGVMMGVEDPFNGGDFNPALRVSPETLGLGLAGDGSGGWS